MPNFVPTWKISECSFDGIGFRVAVPLSDRATQDLRTETVTSSGGAPAAELDPNNPTSLRAQNPTDSGNLRVGHASEEAASIPAIWNTMLYGIGEMGPLHKPSPAMLVTWIIEYHGPPDQSRRPLVALPGLRKRMEQLVYRLVAELTYRL